MATKINSHVDYSNLNPTFKSNQEVGKLAPTQFEYFRKLIYDCAGISLHASKSSLVSTRLSKRLRALKLVSWDDYIKVLESHDRQEVQFFINALTTNKTEFFREAKHFDYLRETFLPLMVAHQNWSPLFWIGATSYGHEVYSLIMTIEEFNRTHQVTISPRILATDIDTQVLGIASEGIYELDVVTSSVPESLLRRYFLTGTGKNKDKVRFDPAFSSNVKFRQHNLVDFSAHLNIAFDAILLRNVLIYFDPPTVEKVISKVLSHLKPQGVMILGHTESILDMKWNLVSAQQSVYIKKV